VFSMDSEGIVALIRIKIRINNTTANRMM